MAGLINSFQSGSNLELRFGNMVFAYGQDFRINDSVQHQEVGGIGSYSYDADEPLSYAVNWSLTINSYTSAAANAIGVGDPASKGPQRAPIKNNQDDISDGNGLLLPGSFNPILFLVSQSFNIVVYEKALVNGVSKPVKPIYTVEDCFINRFSLSVQSSQLVNHSISGLAIKLVDHTVQ